MFIQQFSELKRNGSNKNVLILEPHKLIEIVLFFVYPFQKLLNVPAAACSIGSKGSTQKQLLSVCLCFIFFCSFFTPPSPLNGKCNYQFWTRTLPAGIWRPAQLPGHYFLFLPYTLAIQLLPRFFRRVRISLLAAVSFGIN